MSPLSRRTFLGRSLRLGGAVALGAAGLGAETLTAATVTAGPADGAERRTIPPPVNVQSFVSRPDLKPVGISTVRYSFPVGEPEYMFIATHAAGDMNLPPGAQRGLMICDLDGRLVWFKPMTGTDYNPFNFRVQTYQGQPTLTWYQGLIGSGYGIKGSYAVYDNTYSEITTFEAVNWPSDAHEFIITPEDTALVTTFDFTQPLVNSHAEEIDIASKELVYDWASYPTIPISESYTNTDGTGDYFHINSIDLWPGPERNLLISSRNTCAVYQISRQTGGVVWKIGGKNPSFDMVGNGTRFSFQHDARPLADRSGISLYDDASSGSPEKQSWGKVFTVDDTTRQVTLRHQYCHASPPILVPSQGNVQLLPTGGHFIGWGHSPYISEYGSSGNAVTGPLVLDGVMAPGASSYRSFMFDWVANPPLHSFALVVQDGSGSGSFTAYVSWNGATEVASWQLSAGPSSASLSTVTTVAKDGFETTIPFSYSGATAFQVAALSGSGAVLGTSGVVSAS
jgi:hypothetical protein